MQHLTATDDCAFSNWNQYWKLKLVGSEIACDG
jgi:hypothetical protein